MVKLVKAGTIHSCKAYSGNAAGDLVKTDAKVAAGTDSPLGFLVNEIPTDNPPRIHDVYGQGSIIDMTGATGWSDAAVGTVMWSDGDGTVSSAIPNPGVGTQRWVVGRVVGDEDGGNSALLEVNIYADIDQVA